MKKLKRAGKRFNGFTVGMDVHKKFIEYVIMDRFGNEVAKGRMKADWAEIVELLDRWLKKGEVQVAFEASGSCYWVFDGLVEKLGRERVQVAHAGKVKVIAESGEKNDENDAWWLAYLQWDRRLPKSYLPEGVLRELRIAGRELRYITDQRSDLLRRLRSLMLQRGVKLPSQWWTSKVKRQVVREEIKKSTGTLKRALQKVYQQIMSMGKDRTYWVKKMGKLSRKLPDVKTIQDGMPGLKKVTGAIAYGELGDPRRFRSEKAYAKATGLTPRNRSTGGKKLKGPITKEGSEHARWAFTRAAVACLKCKKGAGVVIGDWVRLRMRHKPKKMVLVAAARKLAEGVWRLFNYGEVFDLKKAFPVPKRRSA
jgi:transposase